MVTAKTEPNTSERWFAILSMELAIELGMLTQSGIKVCVLRASIIIIVTIRQYPKGKTGQCNK